MLEYMNLGPTNGIVFIEQQIVVSCDCVNLFGKFLKCMCVLVVFLLLSLWEESLVEDSRMELVCV